MVEGYKRRTTRRTNELIYLAWHTEAFARQNPLPPIKTFLIDEDKPEVKRTQTDDEMLSIVKMLNLALGGEVVEV